MQILLVLRRKINDKDVSEDIPTDEAELEGGTDNADTAYSRLPYLRATIKWAKLCSDMWDTMFGVNSHPASTEFVAVTDARILLLLGELPDDLHWLPDLLQRADNLQLQLFTARQSIVLLLVIITSILCRDVNN